MISDNALPTLPTPLERINDDFLSAHEVALWVKRDDLMHSHVMGNKWRKLKYNLSEAKELKCDTLATFGGAYSNHIYATAAAGRLFGFKTLGYIRGEQHMPLNPILEFATSCGMKLTYIDRETYRRVHDGNIVEYVKNDHGRAYILPEGGANALAVKGCEEIVTEINVDFDIVCVPCGTGGTLAGIIRTLSPAQSALGFSVLKDGAFLENSISQWLSSSHENAAWSLSMDYHFGGYAKSDPRLISFMEDFSQSTKIPLDYVYMGKMMYGIYDLIRTQRIPKGSRVIALHTGGYIPTLDPLV